MSPISTQWQRVVSGVCAPVLCPLSDSMSHSGTDRNNEKEIPSQIVIDGSFIIRFVIYVCIFAPLKHESNKWKQLELKQEILTVPNDETGSKHKLHKSPVLLNN